jgi:hypothetical protein
MLMHGLVTASQGCERIESSCSRSGRTFANLAAVMAATMAAAMAAR